MLLREGRHVGHRLVPKAKQRDQGQTSLGLGTDLGQQSDREPRLQTIVGCRIVFSFFNPCRLATMTSLSPHTR